MTDPAVRIREAFRYVTLGLLEWQDPPELTRREYAARIVYRPFDPQGEVEPFDVDADWEERS